MVSTSLTEFGWRVPDGTDYLKIGFQAQRDMATDIATTLGTGIGRYRGTGATAFPATELCAGDSYVWGNSTVGYTLWRYTGTRWVLAEAPIFATVAARDAWMATLPTGVPYQGMDVWLTPQGQFHSYDANTSTWRGNKIYNIGMSVIDNTRTTWNDTSWHIACYGALTDPGYAYWLDMDFRLEVNNGLAGNRIQWRVHADTSNIDVGIGYIATPGTGYYHMSGSGFYSATTLAGAQSSVHLDMAGYVANQAVFFSSYEGFLGVKIIPTTHLNNSN